MKLPVLVVGSANVDEVFLVDSLPSSGETVFGRLVTRSPGGKGLNQAIASHRAGAKTSFVLSLGQDENSKFLQEYLLAEGLPIHTLHDSQNPTGRALIAVDDAGSNQIIVLPGSNLNSALGDSSIGGRAGFLVLQLEIGGEANLRLARAARDLGWKVVLTPAPVDQLSPALLEFVDLLVLNETEAQKIFGTSDLSELSASVRPKIGLVIVTLGHNGCLVLEPGKPATHYPAFEVETEDTTGAGDTFCGYLVANLALEKSLTESIKYATAASAISVQSVGAAASIPKITEVEEMLRTVATGTS